jgi:hypothetical protein
MAVTNGVAIPVGTKVLLISGSDGTNARTVKVTAAGRVVTDGSEVTSPISAASLPLPTGAATDTGLAAIFTRLADGSQVVTDGGGSLTIDNTNLDVALSTRATEATLATRLSKADFEARINTLGQKTMALSTPVTMASNQTAIPITFTPANARTGVSSANLVLGGSTANTLITLRNTVYNEPTAAAQRSIASNDTDDTAAGLGARTVRITYFDGTGDGPFTETVTMNGTTAVNTVATNIRFIEKMEVLTSGADGANDGVITLYTTTGGGGTVIGTIGVGGILATVGDNTTLWAHHYVPVNWTAGNAVLTAAIQQNGAGTSGKFFLRVAKPLVANTTEIIDDGVLLLPGAFQRQFQYHTDIVGFARVTAYCIPSVNNTEVAVSFDWSEVPS